MVDPKLREELIALCREGHYGAASEVASRILAAAQTKEALSEILRDPELRYCHGRAGEALMALPGGKEEARLVLAQASTWRGRGLAAARLSASELYDFFEAVAPTMTGDQARDLWFSILWTPGGVRDRRWVERADPADSAGLNGAAMLIAIGKDPGNPARDEAVAKLVRTMEAVPRSDSVGRGGWVHALGETRSPNAVEALLRELETEKYPSLVLHSLRRCGGLDIVAALERRAAADPSHERLYEHAIEEIQARAAREARIAADPTLAALTRSAHAGDLEAAAVLEDALRERGLRDPDDS